MMGVVIGWLARARSHPRASEATHPLAHPRSTLVIGLVCTGFFLLLAVWSALYPGKTGRLVLEGRAEDLRENAELRKAYLGR